LVRGSDFPVDAPYTGRSYINKQTEVGEGHKGAKKIQMKVLLEKRLSGGKHLQFKTLQESGEDAPYSYWKEENVFFSLDSSK